MNDSSWYKDAVFYELYPRAFFDSNGDGHGDLNGITVKLDYLCDLGVDVLWLLPIFESPLVDDGYDVSDFYRIQARFGTVADFKALIDGAHARGMRVIADLVMNHTSDQHPWFVQARASRHAPKRDYYVWSADDKKYRDARIIFVDSQKSNWQFDPATGEYYFHRFFPEQPDLNYDNPAVAQAMLDVVDYWLSIGLDGFRCDAVPYLFEREDTNCENLPETHAFLKRVRRMVDEKYPGRLLLAEANQPPNDVCAYFGDGDEFHMAFHFPLMPQIFIALRKQDARLIAKRWCETPPIPASAQWGIFLRNHDELTLEMVMPEERDFMWDTYAPDPRMRLNIGIRRRLAPLLDNDRRKIELAYSLILTLPGSPIFYYGNEIGMGDNLALKDRDGVRTPMQWDDTPNAGFSTADSAQLYARVIDDAVFGYKHVNVAAQQRDPSSLLNTIRRMIATRKRHRVFGRGTCEFLTTENNAVLAYLRQWKDTTILVAHNLAHTPQTIRLSLAQWTGCQVVDARTWKQHAPITCEPYALTLTPFESVWLEFSESITGRGKSGLGHGE